MLIENQRNRELAGELASLMGEAPAEAVEKALQERIERERRRAEERRALRSIAKQFRDAAPVGLSSDHSFLYDEFGLPK